MSDTNIDMSNPEVQFLASWIACFHDTPESDIAMSSMRAVTDAGVNRDWFRDSRYQRIFDAIDAERANGVVDTFKVVSRLDGPEGDEVFLEIYGMGAVASNLSYYINELRKRTVYWHVHKAVSEFMRELRPESVVEQTEDLAAKLRDFQQTMTKGDDKLKKLVDFMAGSLEKKERLHQERFVNHNWRYLDGLPMPWDILNQYYTGLKTGIHVIAALASAGKSTFAADLSVFWDQIGIKHGFVSIDMADEQLADRFPCIVGQVSLAKLNFGGSRNDVDKFKAGFETCARNGNVWITEADDAKTIRELCYRGVKTLGWKSVIIDYLQLVSPEEKGQMPEYTKVQRATQAIKKVAKDLKIPVICLVQLSRKAQTDIREKGLSPDLDALGDSAEIARAASTVLVMYRNEDMAKYWKEQPPTQLAFGDKSNAAIRYGIIKNEDPKQAMARQTGQVALAKSLRPMWLDIIKNQQGGKACLPFVMYPSYFLLRPGNHEGGKMEVTVEGRQKTLPVQMFEQIIDDWTYTAQDWWLEMTNAMPARGFKLMGETYEQLRVRLEEARANHPEVRHFVRECDEYGNEIGTRFVPAADESEVA